MSVDIEAAHSANAFAAIVVEYNRILSFVDQLLIQDIHHFEE